MVPEHRTLTAAELLRHSAWVQKLASRLVRDAGLADDLVQETWVAALTKGPVEGERLRPWLSRVLRNFARLHARSERARTAREQITAESAEDWPSAGDLVERLESQRQLVDALLSLEEPLRATLILRYCEGKSAAEIARMNAVPDSTVRWRVMRGLECLRETLDAQHGGDRRAWCVLLVPLVLRQIALEGGGTLSFGKALVMQMTSKLVLGAAGAILIALFLFLHFSNSRPKAMVGNPRSETVEMTDRESNARPVLGSQSSTGERSSIAQGESPIDPRGAILTATVVDDARQPIAGASLAVENWPGSPGASSDAGGRIELHLPTLARDIDAGETRWITVVAGYPQRIPVHVGLHIELGQTTHLGELRLNAGSTIEGRVLSATGEPRAGIEVLVEVIARNSAFFAAVPENARYGSSLPLRSSTNVPRNKTQADGSFQVQGIEGGYVRIWAVHPFCLAAWSEPIEARAGETQICSDLRLVEPEPGQSIRGRVFAPDGSPVAFAHVHSERFDERRGDWKEVRADEHGEFCFMPEGESKMTTLVARDDAEHYQEATLNDVPLGTRGVEMRLIDWRKMSVTARLESGELVREFGVWTEEAPPMSGDIDFYSPAVHEDGVLAIHVPTRPFQVLAYGAGLEQSVSDPFEPDHAPPSVTIVMKRRPGISGRVTRMGRPVANAEVSVLSQLEKGSVKPLELVRAAPTPMMSRVLGTNSIEKARTDDQGRFYVGLLGQQKCVLRVESPGSAPWLRWGIDAPVTDLDVELNNGAAIEGEVLVSEGQTRSGMLVGATCGDGFVLYHRTDDSGRYRFDRLAPGEWQVRLLGRELTPEEEGVTYMNWGEPEGVPHPPECTLADGETCRHDIDARRGPSPRLIGRVLMDGRGPGPWSVRLHPLDHHAFFTPNAGLGPDGSFAIDAREIGRWRIIVAGSFPEGNVCTIEDELELKSGDNSWSVEFQTGVVSGSIQRPAPLDAASTDRFARVSRSGTQSISAPLVLSADGQLRASRFVAGVNELGYWTVDGSWMSWGEGVIEVLPGRASQIQLR